jgi:hypothetical protein
MDALFPDLLRTLLSFMARYGAIVLLPLVALILWVLVPKGAIRIIVAVLAIATITYYWFGNHPAIAPIVSAMTTAAYHFRSLF